MLALWLPLSKSLVYGAGLGALCGVLALFGDLAISMVKRQVGVKDSGKLFPGHGGMLDRIDSVLFVLPFLYQALSLFP
jgi:phosphatidate cytidylyltransferase